MPDLVRCPSCGAGNPAEADWCGQCLRRFDGADEATRPDGEPSAVTMLRPGGVHPKIQPREGEEPVWTCPACETENPLSASVCARCGSAFTSFFDKQGAAEAPRKSGTAAIGLSAVLPGAGHWIHRQTAPAVARSVLYVWTLGIAVMLLVWPPRQARALVRGVGAVFALAAAAVWLLSMLETIRLGEGDDRPMIPPRALTWFSAGLSALLMLGLLGAVLVGR